MTRERNSWGGIAMVVVGALMLLGTLGNLESVPEGKSSAYVAGYYLGRLLFVGLGVGLIVRGLKPRSSASDDRVEPH